MTVRDVERDREREREREREGERGDLTTAGGLLFVGVCRLCVCQFWGGVARGKREPVFLQ